MSDLKVLMMGGSRCGKTAALTSLFYQATNGLLSNVFSFADQTPPQIKDGEVLETLNNKRLELENAIGKRGHSTFLVDAGRTTHYWDYILRLNIPGTDRQMDIQFRDCAGEIFEKNIDEETVNYINNCDVFIVVVDTPFLMKGPCVTNECANRFQEINAFLKNINRKKTVQVLFVPVKCEKWVKENRIDEVCNAVEQYHRNIIKDLLATQSVEISIIPIETAGDIIFEEFREPYVLRNNNKAAKKCSKVEGDDSVAIMSDGMPHLIEDGEYVDDDVEAVFTGTSIVRPSTWFRLRHAPQAKYTPHNCEQLVIHILRFMFNKKKTEFENRNIFINMLNMLKMLFGGITFGDIKNALQELARLNLIKNQGEGIRILKSCFLPEDVWTKPVYKD